MKLRRLIDGTLADGRGSQLFIVLGLIAVSFGLFCGLSALIFGTEAFKWQDIIALYLDPGVFGGAGEHDWFRLTVTLAGVVLVAATLISVFSNIFENISDGYKKGELRYNFKNHILIIGANDLLIGLLEYIKTKEIEYETKRGKKKCRKKFANMPIVIMTTSPIERLRDEIEAYFNDKAFTRRITFYYDRRENLENLKRAGILKASYAYILGEDNEPNHDIMNLMCIKLIRDLLKGTNRTDFECLAIMDSQTTMKAYQEYLTPDDAHITYTENIVNINECRAELALENSCIKDINSLGDSDTKDLNIVILGMSALGRALAITSAYAGHFKNGRRTKITIIDEDIENKVYEFKNRYNILLDDYGYTYSDNIKEDHNAKTDVSWRFINSSASTPDVMDYLRQRQKDSHLYIYVCYDDIKKNVATEVALRNVIDGLKVYSDFGEYDDAFAMYDTSAAENETSRKFFTGMYGCISKLKQYNYIFEDRHKAAEKFYEEANKVGEKWANLSFSNKHRRVYESIIHGWWKKNPEVYELKTCYRDIVSIAVYGETGDRFRHLADGLRYKSGIKKLKMIQQEYLHYLNNDIEGDLASYLSYENDAIIWDDRYLGNRYDCDSHRPCAHISKDSFIINEDFMYALCNYSERRDISDTMVSNLFKFATYGFKEIELKEKIYWGDPDEGLFLIDYTYVNSEEKGEDKAKYNKIKEIACQTLLNSAKQGNRQAPLALLAYELQEKQNASKLWLERFKTAINNLGEHLPEWFLQFISASLSFNKIPFEAWKQIYKGAGLEEIMNHYLHFEYNLWHDPNYALRPDRVREIVNFINKVDESMSDGDIYLRIAEVPGKHTLQKCAWLIKAERFYLKKASLECCKESELDYEIIHDSKGNEKKSYLLDKYLHKLLDIYEELCNQLEEISDAKKIFEEYNRRKEHLETLLYGFYPYFDATSLLDQEFREEHLPFLGENNNIPAEESKTGSAENKEYDRESWEKEFPGVPYWEDYVDKD